MLSLLLNFWEGREERERIMEQPSNGGETIGPLAFYGLKFSVFLKQDEGKEMVRNVQEICNFTVVL